MVSTAMPRFHMLLLIFLLISAMFGSANSRGVVPLPSGSEESGVVASFRSEDSLSLDGFVADSEGEPKPTACRKTSTFGLMTIAGVGFLAGGLMTASQPVAHALLVSL
eukprot:TRINITY_DN69608_c0_g1_i1.p1 TRINITY_DN69608_c0_g1~~TRINITY_DN69608_c0_g1_i1.p1  ORF type:complete len:108 (-),score=13.20 TRINITY_DN69608_c0_g1_i1:99-422(-)